MGSIYRVITRLTPSVLFPLQKNKFDTPQPHQKEPTTGMERLERMFQISAYDGMSLELNMVGQSSMMGAFVGAVVGGWIRSRNAYMYFIENNQATIFKTTMDAKTKLQNQVTIAFGRGAFEWAWRMGLFMGVFSFITTVISVYRDKTSVLEYVVAGAVTGGMYKFTMGPAAMLVGACLGAALSSIAGLFIVVTLKVTDIKMADIQKALYCFRAFREYHLNEAIEKGSVNKNDKVTIFHDRVVQSKGGEQKIEELE